MFIQLNSVYLIALLFFLASTAYIYKAITTIRSDPHSKVRQEYLAAVMCMVLSSLFYGLMTIAKTPSLIMVFWAIAFVSYSFFLPAWLRFVSNMINLKHGITRVFYRYVLIIISAILSLLCIIFGDVVFIQNVYGTQFTYSGSLIFRIKVIYVAILSVTIYLSHIRWWYQSKTKRHRRQQFVFLLLTLIFSPFGYFTDFYIPAFTNYTTFPLVSIFLLPASFQLFLSMKINRTLNITAQNVAGYILKSVLIPIIVLNHENKIGLANKAALDFLGSTVTDKNINEFILLDEKTPQDSFFENSFNGECVQVKAASGIKICEMIFTVERDRFGDALCKVVLLNDITEMVYRNDLLHSINQTASLLLNSNKKTFDDNLFQAIGLVGNAVKVDRVYIWKNHTIDGKLYCSQIFEWSEGAKPQQGNELVTNIQYDEIAIGWEETLSNRKSINNIVCEMEAKEVREHLMKQGIVSILVVPVFLNNQFWGFVGFDDCRCKRLFSKDEETILNSVSLLFANAWLRNTIENERDEAYKLARLTLDSSPFCTQIWDRNYNIIDCNEAAVKLYKFKDKEEYLKRFIAECFPEYQSDGQRSDEKAVMLINKAFNDGYCVFEWMNRIPSEDNDKLIPIEVTLVRTKYEHDDIVLGYTRDLREQNKMIKKIAYRDKLLNSVNRMAVLILNSDMDSFEKHLYEGIEIIADAAKVDCVYLWENHTVNGEIFCSQVFEWPSPKTKIKNGVLYKYNDVLPGWYEKLSNGKSINSLLRDLSQIEQDFLSSEGILSVLVVPVFIEERFWGFIGFDDCNRERIFTENEESILHSASLLVANAFVRKGMFQNLHETSLQLESALEQANEASKSKSNFLATMSHEIRTPLNTIIGTAQLQLQNKKLHGEYAEALERINHSGNNLLGIINDILDLSKIETGKIQLNPHEYDVPSLINDTVHLNIVNIGSKSIKFILDVDENLPSRILGDELRIKQILNNLLSNAIKYTEEGIVKLSVSHSVHDGDIMLHFIVEDTGQGIKQADLDKLFLEYTQFNTEANRNVQGTGLGLPIVKKLVNLMNGSIEVESEYGKGSKFTVTVLQKAIQCEAIGAELSGKLRDFSFMDDKRVNDMQISRNPMPYGKVLVVDDVKSNLYVAEGLLSLYDLKIDSAESGLAAIEKIKKGANYDVIFMDHMMPVMDGIETTQRLRSMGYKGVIVALTANALTGNDKIFMQSGFDGFISKPIDLRHLDTTLNKFIRDRHPAEAKKYKAVTAEEIIKTNEANTKLLDVFRLDAENAVSTLHKIVFKGKFRRHNDIKLFTTTVHAMKSALANIGENGKSAFAQELEKAGRENNLEYISANISSFMDMLEVLIKDLTPAETAESNDAEIQEDTVFLKEQLLKIKTACENYDDVQAYVSLDSLKEKTWKKQTSASLEKIRDILFLDSNFEEAAKLVSILLS